VKKIKLSLEIIQTK